MKKIYLFICLAILGLAKVEAQLYSILTGSGYPTGLYYNNQTLYVAEFSSNKVSKIDLNSDEKKLVPIIDLAGPSSLLMYNDYLYALSGEDGKVVKIDLNSTPITSEDVIDNLNGPLDMELYGSELYISETDKISKFDLAGDISNKTIVMEIQYPSGLAVYGTDLYYAEFYANAIYKINVSNDEFVKKTVATGISGPWDLDVIGDKLYIAEYNDGEVSSIELTQTDNTYKVEIADLDMVIALAHGDNKIFIGEWGNDGRISYLDISSMGTSESSNSKIFFSNLPNSKRFVFSGLERSTKFYITNLKGQKLLKGVIDNKIDIDLSTLSNGIYIISLESGESFKFIIK